MCLLSYHPILFIYLCYVQCEKRDFLGTAGLKKVSKELSQCWQFEPGLVCQQEL